MFKVYFTYYVIAFVLFALDVLFLLFYTGVFGTKDKKEGGRKILAVLPFSKKYGLAWKAVIIIINLLVASLFATAVIVYVTAFTKDQADYYADKADYYATLYDQRVVQAPVSELVNNSVLKYDYSASVSTVNQSLTQRSWTYSFAENKNKTMNININASEALNSNGLNESLLPQVANVTVHFVQHDYYNNSIVTVSHVTTDQYFVDGSGHFYWNVSSTFRTYTKTYYYVSFDYNGSYYTYPVSPNINDNATLVSVGDILPDNMVSNLTLLLENEPLNISMSFSAVKTSYWEWEKTVNILATIDYNVTIYDNNSRIIDSFVIHRQDQESLLTSSGQHANVTITAKSTSNANYTEIYENGNLINRVYYFTPDTQTKYPLLYIDAELFSSVINGNANTTLLLEKRENYFGVNGTSGSLPFLVDTSGYKEASSKYVYNVLLKLTIYSTVSDPFIPNKNTTRNVEIFLYYDSYTGFLVKTLLTETIVSADNHYSLTSEYSLLLLDSERDGVDIDGDKLPLVPTVQDHELYDQYEYYYDMYSSSTNVFLNSAIIYLLVIFVVLVFYGSFKSIKDAWKEPLEDDKELCLVADTEEFSVFPSVETCDVGEEDTDIEDIVDDIL